MSSAWMCSKCHSPADGDLCQTCGAFPDYKVENGVEPGSYASIHGWPRTSLAARWFAFILGPMLIAMLATMATIPEMRWFAIAAVTLLVARLAWSYGLKRWVYRRYLRRRFHS